MHEYSDEEKQLIEEAYKELHEGEEQEAGSSDYDAKIAALATVVEAIVFKLADLESDVSNVCRMVDVDLIQGAKKLASATSRKLGVAGVMSKYKDKFGPYEEPFKAGLKESGEELPDLWEQIFDILEDIKQDPEYNEESEASTVEGLLGQFKERFPEIGEPAEEKKEAKAESKEEDGVSRAKDYVKKFLDASRAAGKQ